MDEMEIIYKILMIILLSAIYYESCKLVTLGVNLLSRMGNMDTHLNAIDTNTDRRSKTLEETIYDYE